jgi:hypothetical protein
MFIDFIQNGVGHGELGETLAGCQFDPGLLRPYFDEQGRRCCTVNTGKKKFDAEKGLYIPQYEKRLVGELMNSGISSPVFNSTSLRKDEWILLDQVVLQSARPRLRAWQDLAVNTFGGFDGMSKTVLEHETMTDPGEAVVDMDGLTDGRTDSPRYQLEGLPLPITHADFYFSARRLAASRNSGTPLDTTMAEAAGRRVAEMIERTVIGVETGITYGKAASYGRPPSVYGYTNFPTRATKSDLTKPTAGGWTPATTVNEVLAMRDALYDINFYGPFQLYTSNDWDQYLDMDYYNGAIASGVVAPSKTLRSRLKEIEGIVDVKRLDFFADEFSMVMVQMTSDVARAVVGMPMTTVQWESVGGMKLNFKVMAIMVPQIRANYDGTCGICHGYPT